MNAELANVIMKFVEDANKFFNDETGDVVVDYLISDVGAAVADIVGIGVGVPELHAWAVALRAAEEEMLRGDVEKQAAEFNKEGAQRIGGAQ